MTEADAVDVIAQVAGVPIHDAVSVVRAVVRRDPTLAEAAATLSAYSGLSIEEAAHMVTAVRVLVTEHLVAPLNGCTTRVCLVRGIKPEIPGDPEYDEVPGSRRSISRRQ